MITKVNLKSVASYDGIGAKLSDLKKVNFIYGNNGCGKSTLSNYFYNPEDLKYSNSEIVAVSELEYIVYNKKFIDDNFKNDSLPGIFTLGKDYIEMEEEINDIEGQIEKNKTKILDKDRILLSVQDEIKQDEKTLNDTVWKVKTEKTSKWHPIYQKVFTGLNNSKVNFYNHFLTFARNIFSGEESELFDIANKILNSELEVEEEIRLNFPLLKIDTSVFIKPIIGNNDVDLANLVNKLNISDWVEEGKGIIDNYELDICPLCQNKISEKLIVDLNEYFNETYKKDITNFKNEIQEFDLNYKELCMQVSAFNDNKYLKEYMAQLLVKLENAKLKIQHQFDVKLTSPSNTVKIDLSDFENILEEIKNLIEDANGKIKSNNQLANNLEAEKARVSEDVKNMFAQSISQLTSTLLNKIDTNKNKLQGIENVINNITSINLKLQDEKDKLLKDKIGINESSININQQLKSFGFENFELKEEVGTGKYSIIRENGELANQTLSEGEKTFITFLYYYQKVVSELQNEVKKKVLIIDDPISSLDSTVMYIVSSLIKDLINRMEKGQNYIEQMIILTHNTYFYKEITYKVSEKNDFAKYFILRKLNNVSKITEYVSNPIRTSYEELWRELETVKDTSSNIIQNVMRRILENYFRFLGDIKLQDLCDPFDEITKPIVSSLVMWTHDGSHSIQDELYVEQSSELNIKYYQVFKEIFIKHNQEAHFNMMVQKCFDTDNRNIFDITELQSA